MFQCPLALLGCQVSTFIHAPTGRSSLQYIWKVSKGILSHMRLPLTCQRVHATHPHKGATMTSLCPSHVPASLRLPPSPILPLQHSLPIPLSHSLTLIPTPKAFSLTLSHPLSLSPPFPPTPSLPPSLTLMPTPTFVRFLTPTPTFRREGSCAALSPFYASIRASISGKHWSEASITADWARGGNDTWREQ